MRRFLGTALLVLAAAGPGAALEFSIGGAAGLHLPTQQAFRDVYGSGAVFGLDVRCIMLRNFGLSAGIVTLRKSGTAVSLDGGTESMGVRLRLKSVPLIVSWHIPRGLVSLDLGAGLAYHDFEETWAEGAGPTTAGTKWGLLAAASVAYELAPRLSITGTLRYLDISTGRPSPLTAEVNLGGFQVLVGASWTFVR